MARVSRAVWAAALVAAMSGGLVGATTFDVPASAAQILTTCTFTVLSNAVAGGGTIDYGGTCTVNFTSQITIGPSQTVNIDAGGHSVVFDGNGTTRLFGVNGGPLTLTGVELRTGHFVGTSGTAGLNGAPGANGTDGTAGSVTGESGGSATTPGGTGGTGGTGGNGAAGAPGGSGQPGGIGGAAGNGGNGAVGGAGGAGGDAAGAAIYAAHANLSFTNVLFSNDCATGGAGGAGGPAGAGGNGGNGGKGGIGGTGGQGGIGGNATGGAIYATTVDAQASFTNVSFSNNSAARACRDRAPCPIS